MPKLSKPKADLVTNEMEGVHIKLETKKKWIEKRKALRKTHRKTLRKNRAGPPSPSASHENTPQPKAPGENADTVIKEFTTVLDKFSKTIEIFSKGRRRSHRVTELFGASNTVLKDFTTVLRDFDKTIKRSNNGRNFANIILGLYVIATIAMAVFTWKMARSTKELVQWYQKPKLAILLLTQGPPAFRVKIYKKGGIEFTVKEYLAYRDDVEFYVRVKNNWDSRITERLNVTFKTAVISHEGEDLSREKNRKLNRDFDLQLAPNTSARFPVDGMKKKLVDNKHLGLLSNDFFADKSVRLEISGLGISVEKFPFASFQIEYGRIKKNKYKMEPVL